MYLLGRGKSRSFMGKMGLAALLSLSMVPMSLAQADEAAIQTENQGDMPTPTTKAPAMSSNDIRVVLFADLGTQYKAIQSTVTLTGANGYQIGVKDGAGFDAWLNVSSNQSVKFSVDRFMVKVQETSDTKEVAGIVNRLQSMKEAPQVIEVNRKGIKSYQIVLGDYASNAEAAKVRDRMTSDSTLAAYYKNGKPVVTGNLHYSAGSYGSEQQAAAVQQSALDAGLDAMLALQKDRNGALRFDVWVGQASDAAELSALKSDAAQKIPGVALQPVDTSRVSLIVRDDATTTYASGQDAIPHYYVSGDADQKIWMNSSDAGIQVTERSKRTYRGSLEVSAYNNRLALVNELPLEQYLYSVVAMEVSPSWPQETLKAQAVAARSYALFQGMKFKIGQVVDTTLSQAYYGMEKEHPNTNAAVDATAGIVMKVNGKIIEPVYSSNSGGKTADAAEIWGNPTSYLVSVDSPDEAAENGLPYWYRVMLNDGTTGYVREDMVQDTGTKTQAGLPIFKINTADTNIRPIPLIQSDVKPEAVVSVGTQVVVLERTIQSNTMHWVRGTYTSDELLKSMTGKVTSAVNGPITSLEVSSRGSSDRVTEVKVNGQVLAVKNPDTLRSALNGLPSTRFDIEETGRYTILGADGVNRTVASSNGTVQAITNAGKAALQANSNLFMGADQRARVVTGSIGYRFIGTGNGHGVGMSQWGAKGLADQGYDYQKILQYYYKDINLVKD
ncbi:hypothetical protein BVG16_06445 [Paenibacillus selenitireducens]|uniref:Sporulation stage II protein D amidase enhancer LytB N-terminal domain-containing protein n=1 Tax=Paenibacillus selenitireducens TaxID=1324314 RepID=A0A1T2XKN6_9BACL|nr:SpoIID/LytB domain-containing protein [Paenibacillus selenitireducens]OPA80368.1 hypothetical protein BVG16_06445 [Paenibacillus selenitireducens]